MEANLSAIPIRPARRVVVVFPDITLHYNVTALRYSVQAVGRRTIHNERTRTALLDAAELMIGEAGLDSLSVRSVAGAVGVSTRAVYSVFGSKEALLRGLAVHAFQQLMTAFDAVPLSADPVEDVKRCILDGFRPFAIKHRDLFRLAFLSFPIEGGPNVERASSSALSHLVAHVGRAQAVGAIRAGNAVDIAIEVAAFANGLAAMELSGGLAEAPVFWERAVDDVLAAVASPRSRG